MSHESAFSSFLPLFSGKEEQKRRRKMFAIYRLTSSSSRIRRVWFYPVRGRSHTQGIISRGDYQRVPLFCWIRSQRCRLSDESGQRQPAAALPLPTRCILGGERYNVFS